MSAEDDLKNVISNGIVIDIYNAEEAYALEEFIGVNAEAINQATFGAFFGSMQLILNRQLILSVARLFENPNKWYPIMSIPAALQIMEKNSDKLPIPQKPDLTRELGKLGLDASKLAKMNDSEVTNEVVRYFRGITPKPKRSGSLLDEALHATKTIRDKSVAHHEMIAWEALPKPIYSELKELIEFGKHFISVMAFGYTTTAYTCDDGDYSLSSDATRSLRCLKRIFEKLEIEVKKD